jgi:hypothetical protein
MKSTALCASLLGLALLAPPALQRQAQAQTSLSAGSARRRSTSACACPAAARSNPVNGTHSSAK